MNESEHQDVEYVIGKVSTRPVQLTTGEHVQFALTALQGIVSQVETGFLPMHLEHLTYLPPRGRVARAEVVESPDGEFELTLFGRDLQIDRAGELALKPAEVEEAQAAERLEGIEVSTEPRNFEPDVWDDLRAGAPLPVRESSAWSQLPPLILMISIPVVWGAAKFAGSFLARLGEAAADGLIGFLKRAARSSKETDREALVELRFALNHGPTVLGFIPFDASSDASVEQLSRALQDAGPLAEFSGSVANGQQPSEMRTCAFLWDTDQWRLAWWVSDEAVHITLWFNSNYPDPQRFLGRPLFEVEDESDHRLNPPGG